MEMEAFSETFLIAIAIALVFLYQLFSLLKSSNNVNLPPGPAPFPIIGSLQILGNLPHRSLADLAKIHGPIMSLKLGRTTTVVLSSPATAKEILQKRDLAFSTRSVSDALHAHHHSNYSVIWLPVSARWRSIRKILSTHMFSVNRLDASNNLRARKIDELVKYCQERGLSGEPVDVGQVAFSTSLNVLSNMIFSTDLSDFSHGSCTEFRELVWNIMVEGGKINFVDFYPWLKRFDPQGRRRRMGAHFSKILNIFNELICQRVATRKSEKNDVNCIADVLDVCLNIAQENPEEFDLIHMERLFLDLFAAGTDTTSSTIEWTMSELLRNPIKMTKAKLELKKVIGQGKTLKDSDIKNLPYLNCAIKETLRMHPPGPFLIPRKVETDVEVFGYVIPKGSQVLVNVYAIGRDPIIWEDPLLFKPERFLDSDMDVRGQDFEFTPFGSGRRICPGIPLAMRIVPLMLGSLLNCFDWKIEGGIEPNNLDMGEKSGITLQKALPLRAIPTLIMPDN